MKYPTLEILRLELDVHLGCTEQERANTQKIEISIKIEFPSEPAGAKTDTLSDTFCYARICEIARQIATAHPFQLIEAIGYKVADALTGYLDGNYDLSVCIHKLNPPIANLRGGTAYTCHRTVTKK